MLGVNAFVLEKIHHSLDVRPYNMREMITPESQGIVETTGSEQLLYFQKP